MPWKVTRVVDHRMELVTRYLRGERATELAKEFGISRKTASKFIARYREVGPSGLDDASRARHSQSRRTSPAVEDKIVALRRLHPTWGSKKLKKVLEDTDPGVRFPARSTFDEILERRGMTVPRRRRRLVPTHEAALTKPVEPNDVWAVDYKGEFRLGNGRMCYPLTSTDLASRFLLACEAFERIEGASAEEVFQQLFATYGLPSVIRSDNGAPFASARSIHGLTKLNAFWLSLGIVHERIEPGKPQQNGSHERMHRTLKQETTRPAGQNVLQQQERFDHFRSVFNEKRPHEALSLARPSDVYRPSSKRYPPRPTDYSLFDDAPVVTKFGHVLLGGTRAFLTTALAGHRVGVRELADDHFLVRFASLDLGVFHRRNGWLDSNGRNSPPVT